MVFVIRMWYSHLHAILIGVESSMNTQYNDEGKVNINHGIRTPELRVTGPEGENFGIMSKKDAIRKAETMGLDLIEVSAKAVPPVAKITDYGRFTYELKKKQREIKSKSHAAETKVAQVKIGTGERDKELKIERIQKWLLEGHRVKVDLFLWGRYKYMEQSFLTDRLGRFLEMVAVPYKISEDMKKSPKGYSCTIERDKSKPAPTEEDLEKKKAERTALQKKEKKEKKKGLESEKRTELPLEKTL